MKKCLNQEVFKTLLEDKNINHKCNYLKTSKNECAEMLLENLEFKDYELTYKLKEDLNFGNYNNINKIIDKGANKDKVFLELSSGNDSKSINYLIDNQKFSKEVLEQGLINSVKKGKLNEYEEEINVFDKNEGINLNLKKESNNIFNSLYEKFEFNKETYEKVIKEGMKQGNYELVSEIAKEQKIIIQEIDLTSMKIINPEEYEILNKINMKNKLSDKLEPKNKNKDIDLIRKI